MSTQPSTILVTGASGFIATHTIIQLLEKEYTVRCTLRNMAREQEIRAIIATFTPNTERLHFTPAELTSDIGWDTAMQGCRYVLHIASPVPIYDPKDENELIIPAVQGTLHVMRAAHTAHVQRVVLVSSVAAITSGHNGENRTFTEADWPANFETISIYQKSKALAERAAWDFIQSAENTNQMELSVINPPYVMGPIPSKTPNASSEVVRTLLRNKMPGVGKVKIGIVDVRDTATAMIQAMTIPEASGKRFLVSAGELWLKEIADILANEYSKQGYKIPQTVFPSFLVRIIALFDKKVARLSRSLDWDMKLSNEQARRILKWSPRPTKETVLATAKSLIEHDLISPPFQEHS